MMPHPFTATVLARQRRAEHLAEADRYCSAQRVLHVRSNHRDRGVLLAVFLGLAAPWVALVLG